MQSQTAIQRRKSFVSVSAALNKHQSQTAYIQWGNQMLSYLVVHIPISRQLRLCVSFFWQSPLFCHWSKDDEQCNEEQLLGLLKMHGLCAHWQSLPLQITPNSRTSAGEVAEGERKTWQMSQKQFNELMVMRKIQRGFFYSGSSRVFELPGFMTMISEPRWSRSCEGGSDL